jgi:Na+-driven multidrug efflux pump
LHVYGGDSAIAVMGILYSLFMLIAMPIIGINQGAQPIIGYNYGALRFDRVKRTLEIAILAASVLTSFGFVVMLCFPTQVMQLFAPHEAGLLAEGTHAIRIAVIMLPIVGFQIISSGYFQAVGKPREAIFLSMSRQVLLLTPAALILPVFFGLDGVWASMPTADFVSSMLTAFCPVFEMPHLTRRHASHTEVLTQPH